MKYFLYILKSEKDNNLYVGITRNVQERLREHNAGNDRSTKSRRPFRVVYEEQFDSKSEAAKKEWFLKNTPEGGILKKKLVSQQSD